MHCFLYAILYFSVVLILLIYPSDHSTVVTHSGRCCRCPVVGMKTSRTAANYAAGMWQSWASSASWTSWTADGETSLGSASRLTVWAWACRCQCSQLIGPAVSLYGYGNQGRSRMCTRWGSQRCVHKQEFHICASHFSIYFIYVREPYVVILSFTQGWCTYLMDCFVDTTSFPDKILYIVRHKRKESCLWDNKGIL